MLYALVTASIEYALMQILYILTETMPEMAWAWLLLWYIAFLYVGCKLILAQFVLADNGGRGVWQALAASVRMMNWKAMLSIICLSLSFIGWMFAAVMTCGMALIVIVPYVSLSVAVLYEELKEENNCTFEE